MHPHAFLQDLAVVLFASAIAAITFRKLRLPTVLGYILAGVLIGPHLGPTGLIQENQSIATLSELGVVFLMFSLGMEFSLRKLKKVGWAASIAAALEILLMMWAGYEIGRAFGWTSMNSIFLGAMLSISSTTIIVKALADLGKTKENFATLVFGILIVEDILAVVLIALLSGVALTGKLEAVQIGATLGKLAIFLAVTLVVGFLVVPRWIEKVARTKSNEMLLITVLGLCVGVSALAVKFGYRAALGAFLIGTVVAETPAIGRIEVLTEPVRDLFSAIFFVSIGLMVDPQVMATHALPIAVITVVVIVGKLASCTLGALLTGNDLATSLKVGSGLSQIGEFSFIIAGLGLSLGVTDSFLYTIAVAVSAITTLATPAMIQSSDNLVAATNRWLPPRWKEMLSIYSSWLGRFSDRKSPSLASRLIRSWVLQTLLNLVLIAGIFLGLAILGNHPPGLLVKYVSNLQALRAGLWFIAMLLSMPLQIATWRKLQALGMLVAEIKVTSTLAGNRTAATRALVANAVPAMGTLIGALLILLLSSTLLPSYHVLLFLLLLVGAVTAFLRSRFMRVYATAQHSLQSTFAKPPPPDRHGHEAPLQGILAGAEIATIGLEKGTACVHQLIRETRLRSETGATLMAIERQGNHLVNPDPEEELKPGDGLVLIGAPVQIAKAREYLAKPKS